MATKAFLSLTERDGTVPEPEIAAVFSELAPITDPSFMFGEWTGGSFENDHPSHAQLKSLNWAGKTFRSEDDVDPMVVYDAEGKRTWLEMMGNARLREVKLFGKSSISMVYDKHPIIDQFRYVTDDLVAGAMDMKPSMNGRVYYFYLKRNSPKKL